MQGVWEAPLVGPVASGGEVHEIRNGREKGNRVPLSKEKNNCQERYMMTGRQEKCSNEPGRGGF